MIWDWNGTLLNDVEVSVWSMNTLLRKYNLAGIDLVRYREIFDFPVKDYYQTAGFDFTVHPWDVVAADYMDIYWQNVTQSKVFDEIPALLLQLKTNGVQLHVLSAMQHSDLVRMLGEHGIAHYFDSVWGVDDHYGSGKTDVARHMVQAIPEMPGNAILIGDTTHDAEVALDICVEPVLVAFGHQSAARLLKKTSAVAENMTSLKTLLLH